MNTFSREYDISVDTEEPQQVLSFVNQQKTTTFNAVDASEREVASFTLGKGRADWGPLTIYAIMRSGDIYSICPYLPQNAYVATHSEYPVVSETSNSSVPSTYVHSLECFISAKQEFISKGSSTASKDLSAIYDYQHKYVHGLIKQIPPNAAFPMEGKAVLLHPPKTIKASSLRQGPFLLQPSPRNLEGSEGGDATDIAYFSFPTTEVNSVDETKAAEQLGVLVASYQDGRVDLFLDVEKVEARWDVKQVCRLNSIQ